MPSGNVTLTTQAEVNAFVAQYPNCTEINGLLTINGGNINNLSGLSNITSITNGLTISQCNTLTSLNGLQNITSINGNISITNNPLLVDLTGLNGLTSLNNNSSGSLGNIFLNQNNNLTSLNGLQNLTNLTRDNLANTRTGFAIYNCNSLTDISALGNINNAVVEFIVLSNNTNLSSCAISTVCNKLAINTDWVTISGNATGCESIAVVEAACNPDPCPPSNVTLTTQAAVDAFVAQYPNCTTIQGNFGLVGESINNISGLSSLTTINGGLFIQNTSLTNLAGLNNLNTVQRITLSSNNVLTDISQLSGINVALTGNISITYNNALISLNGLQNITAFARMTISNNPALTSLSGLDGLSSSTSPFSTSVNIENNAGITSLNGLQNLINFTNSGGIRIFENPLLNDISAIANINSFGALEIVNNIVLSNCAIFSVCNKLNVSPSDVVINGNATGCESIAVVQAACDTLSSSDFELESNLKIYPNPFNSQITFELGNTYENVTVLIHDITGKQLYKNSFSGNQLVVNNLGNLTSGIYVATLTTENGTSITKKIVK